MISKFSSSHTSLILVAIERRIFYYESKELLISYVAEGMTVELVVFLRLFYIPIGRSKVAIAYYVEL